jgi:hypothetical protein
MVEFVTGLVAGIGAATLVVGGIYRRADQRRKLDELFEKAMRAQRTKRISAARPGTGTARISTAVLRSDSPSMRAGGSTELP